MSISISPISLRCSLQNLENIVCHTTGSTSVISLRYATSLPPTDPRQYPIGISLSQHHDTSSDMNNIKPLIPTLWNTCSSSFILSPYSLACDLSIMPLAIFSLYFSLRRSSKICSSCSPYRIGYLKLVSSSKSSTLSAITLVLLMASR